MQDMRRRIGGQPMACAVQCETRPGDAVGNPTDKRPEVKGIVDIGGGIVIAQNHGHARAPVGDAPILRDAAEIEHRDRNIPVCENLTADIGGGNLVWHVRRTC